jgi:hypothetical protein
MVAANTVEDILELETKLKTLTNLTWVYVAAHLAIVVVKVSMYCFYNLKKDSFYAEPETFHTCEVVEKPVYLDMDPIKGDVEVNPYDEIQ